MRALFLSHRHAFRGRGGSGYNRSMPLAGPRGGLSPHMRDGTRLIFWLDIAVLLVLALLVIAGQWDFVIALFVGLIIMNYFDRWWSRRQPH